MRSLRLPLMALGIPGLLLYATLCVAQWRSANAFGEFKALQKAYPPNSLKQIPSSIQMNKLDALMRAERLAPDNPEIAYQTALFHLVRAETESLQPVPGVPDGSPPPGLTSSLQAGLNWINRAMLRNPGYAEYPFVKATLLQNLTGTQETDNGVARAAVGSLLHLSDRLDPYKPALHFRIGSFWLALGSHDEARKAFAVTLADSINYARPVFGLLWSSVDDVNDLQHLVGSSPLARSLLVGFLLEHGYSEEAESVFKSVAALENLDYTTVDALIDYAMKTRKPEEARMLLSKIKLNEGRLNSFQETRLRYLKGQSYYVEGRLQDAIAAYEDAIRYDTEDSYVHEALGNAYQESGDYDRAIARYLHVLNRVGGLLDPKKVSNLHSELAVAYEKNQDYARAIEHYLKAAQIDPSNLEAQKRASELSIKHL